MECPTLQNDACTPPTPQQITDPKQFYVAFAIYAINQAYNTYWNGLTSANTVAAENVPAIIQLLDPPKTYNVLLNDLLTALSVGLAFLGPEDAVIAAMVQGATQTAAVGKFLFPTGTTNSQNAQLASVDQSLGELVQSLQSNIDQALPATLNDPAAFLAFASTGAFSQLPNTSIFDDSSKFLTGLDTYIVSQALQANNIVLTRGPPDTDINEIVHDNNDDLGYQIKGCGNGYDSLDICDTWYHDPDTNQSYAFMKWTDWSHNYNSEMETIFSQWTTPKLLMTDAEACAAAGGAQKAGNVISASPQGVNSDCLSDLKLCTWNQNDQGNSATTQLFSDCDNPGGWEAAGGCANDGTKVPAAYIGPLFYAGDGSCR